MKIKSGDKVKVITGKYKGIESTVEKVDRKNGKVLVENVNMVTRHVKPSGRNQGGLVKVNRPIDISNVILVNEKGEITKVGYKIVDNKKYRVSKKTGDLIDKK